MQKVVGSSPIIRFSAIPLQTAWIGLLPQALDGSPRHASQVLVRRWRQLCKSRSRCLVNRSRT